MLPRPDPDTALQPSSGGSSSAPPPSTPGAVYRSISCLANGAKASHVDVLALLGVMMDKCHLRVKSMETHLQMVKVTGWPL